MDDEYNKILKELQDIIESQDNNNNNAINTSDEQTNIKKKKDSKNKSHNIVISDNKKTKLLNEINDVIDCLKPIVDAL